MKNSTIAYCVILFFSLLKTNGIEAQNMVRSELTVSGIVIDAEQLEPMPGVSVSIKRNGKITGGSITDLNGRYSLEVNASDSLVFSFIGYVTQTFRVGARQVLDVRLSSVPVKLDEVVVTGYQTLSKERATGSFAKVTSETLDRKRLTNLNTLLEGQVAGFTDGQIRGVTSMNGSTTPLYVIDGFPIENVRYNASTATGGVLEGLPELNMEDIESITVLKDAAATSIYGARAANGVVVIITKKAAKGKMQVSFSSTLAFTPYSYYKDNLTDAADIIDIEREWAANNKNLQGATPATYAQNMLDNNVYQTQGIRAILNYHAGNLSQSDMEQKLNALVAQGYRYYEDMEKYAKRNPFQQQYNLSLGKTSDSNMFKASVTYKDNQDANLYSGDRSMGINLTNSLSVTKWLKLDIGAYNYYQDKDAQSFNVSSPGYKYLPYDVLKNADGSNYTSPASERLTNANYALIDSYGLYSMDITPLDELEMNVAKTKTFQNRTYGKLNIKFTDWLDFSSMFQYEYGSERYSKLSDKNSYAVRSRVNYLATRSNNATVFNLPYGNIYNTVDFYSKAYTARQQLNFNKTFGGKHQVTALLGHEVRENKNEFANNTLYNYDPELLSYTLIDAATLAKGVGAFWGGYFYAYDAALRSEKTNRFVSFYGNAAYSYDDKYLLTGSLRWDRSNLWGTASKYQNKPIWSTGVGWNMDKEAFMTVPWINRLKLRASYGIGGNVAKDKAPYMVAYYSTNPNVGGLQGTVSSRPNPELSWEKTTTTNIGIDFALFNDRLSGTLEYYNKYGKDLLASTQGVPTEGWGYSTYQINNGEMRNRGVEITLFGDIIRSNDFTWGASLVYGRNKNEVTYVNVEAPVYYLQLDYPQAFPRIGNPYWSIYAYQWAGLSADGLPQVYNEKGETVSTQPTDLASIVYAGTSVPVHSGSFGSNFRYKNFDLSFMFVFEASHRMRNTFLPALNSAYSSAARAYQTDIAAVNKNIVNRWRNPGDEAHTNIPRIVFAESPNFSSELYTMYANADINVIDASHLRLSNISLAYHVPAGICRKVFLSNARLQFNIENPVTFAKSEEAKYLLGGYNNPTFVCGLHLNF
jgi:TonB-linked SusC/RagA family outer membrane protein